MKIKNGRLSVVLLLMTASSPAFSASAPNLAQENGQTFGYQLTSNKGPLSAQSGQANTDSTTGSFAQQNRQGMLLPGEADVRKLLPQAEAGLPPPYGAKLFAGGYETERSDGLNDNYLIAAGDKLNIWI